MRKEENTTCIFCEILDGRSEASKVYEDNDVIAIMDIQPVNAGHVLIIPKKHIAFLDTENSASGEQMLKAGVKVASAMKKSDLNCEGVNYLIADGEAAGQEVFHVHLHVFPRFKSDGFGFRFREEYYTLPDRKELEEIAVKIKKNII
ncbi:MAG TPA: HIT family protein [Bacteroidia bacterium]|jgi:histidine triad (HIT) family protein